MLPVSIIETCQNIFLKISKIVNCICEETTWNAKTAHFLTFYRDDNGTNLFGGKFPYKRPIKSEEYGILQTNIRNCFRKFKIHYFQF